MTETEKQIQDLLVAVIKMEKTQEATIASQRTTTDNVDKLIGHMDNLLPVHVDIANIKKTLYGLITGMILTILPFGAWITLSHFEQKEILHTHITIQEKTELRYNEKLERTELRFQEKLERTELRYNEKLAKIDETYQKKIHKNENQITYLKGRIKP